MPTVAICTPTTRPFEVEYVASLCQTPGSWIWLPSRNRAVDEARNVLARKALVHPEKPEYILYADSDATWKPGAIQRLMERDLPIVVGGMYRRALPPLPTIGMFVGYNKKGIRTYEFASTVRAILDYCRKHNVTQDSPNELVLDKTTEAEDLREIDGCGMHFMLIKREVFKHIHMPFFRCTGVGAGEDFYFCQKVKAAGFPIYLDLTVHTGHLLGSAREFGVREFIAYFNHVKDVDEVLAGIDRWEVGK